VNLVVQDKLATIVSNSWVLDFDDPGGPSDPEVQALDPIFIQAGLKGIGMNFGSGDWGDNQCAASVFSGCPAAAAPSVYYPASSPYVTGVGGTSLYLDVNGLPAYETGWESGESVLTGRGSKVTWAPAPPGLFLFGAGGGASHRYSQPRWQRSVVPSSLAGASPMRVVPDLAMLADADSGVHLGVTDPNTGIYSVWRNAGGTSLSVQLFAGTMALAEQRAGHRLGFANPLFYRISGQAFHDTVPPSTPQSVTHPGVWTDTEDPPNLKVQRADGTIVPHSLHSALGFDNVTGLGVPAGEAFLQAISGQ
jgi:subtilase family serine protease